jgi:hypothetical protein
MRRSRGLSAVHARSGDRREWRCESARRIDDQAAGSGRFDDHPFHDLEVLNALVEVPKCRDGARLNDSAPGIVAGECPHCVHRSPPTDHPELDGVATVASNELCTEEAGDTLQLGNDDRVKVLGIDI